MSNKYSDWLVVKSKPKSHVSEAYRTLRTNIEFSNLDKPLNTIMVTSAVPQEGKTTNTVNLALTIAESGKKVIIIDVDLRVPLIHKVFNSDSKPGLTNVLVLNKKLSEVIKKADEINSNLYYITSGPIPHNPSELLGSEKMKAVIEELKEQADTLIFDSAPVIGFADSLELANQVDGVVLILNAGMVTRDAAKQAKALLEKAKAKILGVVLNNVDIKREDYYHYYHYYNYSKYYNTEE
jgi:capsular exopolysaccharide synthesis family protein